MKIGAVGLEKMTRGRGCGEIESSRRRGEVGRGLCEELAFGSLEQIL